MAPSPTPAQPGPVPSHKCACSLCARRKIKCDKGDPCSNCVKSRAECLYETPAPSRPRKRAADEDLLARLALYEGLMRKHNIDFTNYVNIWVPSGPEVKPSETETSGTGPSASKTGVPVDTTAARERPLWSDLRSELQYPPTQLLRHKDDPLLHPTPPLQDILTSSQPEIHELHPEPKHIFRLWQIFVEDVDPLIKFVHVPTLQQRTLEASWDPASVSKPLAATLFAVYALAVTSMSSGDCEATFGETRTTLLTRYRTAAVRALVAADVFTTRDFAVLQALVLFLFADPESALSLSLTAVAVKLGQAMGLQREIADSKVPFFQKEMRVRLWWQLRGLEMRTNVLSSIPSSTKAHDEFGDLRLPLNVNDVDLHPDMTEPPVEHSGHTEMLCTLLKFEATSWIRSSSLGTKLFESIKRGPARGKVSLEVEDEAINALEKIYHEKFIGVSDGRIPLHGLARYITKRSISGMRFKVHHPRGRASVSGGDVHMTREELDMIFNSAVTSLEAKSACAQTRFSQHIFSHMTSRFEMDAYIYIISDLRQRCSGERVDLAWKLVEDLYNEHPELINNTDNSFHAALGDLTLEAWDARSQELLRARDVRELDMTPQFIQLLWNKREGRNKENLPIPTTQDPHSLDGFGSMDIYDFDWNYWGQFLRL